MKLYGNYYFGYIWLHFGIAALQIPCHTPKKSQKKNFRIAPWAVPFGSLETPDTLKSLIFK